MHFFLLEKIIDYNLHHLEYKFTSETNCDFFSDHCFSTLLEHWIQLSFFEASGPLFGGIPQNLADFAPLAEAIFYLLIKKKSESPITELDLFMQQVNLRHCEKAGKFKKKIPLVLTFS